MAFLLSELFRCALHLQGRRRWRRPRRARPPRDAAPRRGPLRDERQVRSRRSAARCCARSAVTTPLRGCCALGGDSSLSSNHQLALVAQHPPSSFDLLLLRSQLLTLRCYKRSALPCSRSDVDESITTRASRQSAARAPHSRAVLSRRWSLAVVATRERTCAVLTRASIATTRQVHRAAHTAARARRRWAPRAALLAVRVTLLDRLATVTRSGQEAPSSCAALISRWVKLLDLLELLLEARNSRGRGA